MVETAKTDERMTVDAFLEWDDGTDTRYELIDGLVVAMNPPVARHAALVVSLGAALFSRVKAPCRVYASGGARQPNDDWTYRIPDVSVSCTASDGHWIEAPKLVCEILSPSTGRYDTTRKLEFYRSLASVDEILMLHTDKRHATLWRREADHWIVRDFIGSAELTLQVATRSIPLDELYAPLDLDESEAAPGDPA